MSISMNTLNLFNVDIVLMGKSTQVTNKKTNNLNNTLTLEDRKVSKPTSIFLLDSSFYFCFEYYNFLILSLVLESQLILGRAHLLTLSYVLIYHFLLFLHCLYLPLPSHS